MGIDPAGLAPLANLPPMLALTVTELEALARMGPDAFESWALKGWVKG